MQREDFADFAHPVSIADRGEGRFALTAFFDCGGKPADAEVIVFPGASIEGTKARLLSKIETFRQQEGHYAA
jgi:hypothetical protein